MARKRNEPAAAEKTDERKGPASAETMKKRTSSGDAAVDEAREGAEGARTRIGYTLVAIALIAIVSAFGYISMGGVS